MTSRLLYIGITHESAPLAIRESLRPDEARRRAILDRLAPLAAGRLVLSTCERFELYAMTRCTDIAPWVRLLANWFHLPAALIARHIQSLQGAGAARHFLRVAAGLESRIVGEAQILGQARDAFLLAQSAGSLDPNLQALGRAAIRAGKRVRTETSLNREARSIATIAIDHLCRQAKPLSQQSILLIGTGNLAEVVASELISRKVGTLSLAGRNLERGTALAARFRCTLASLDQLPRLLANADAVVTCTSSPTYIIDPSLLKSGRSISLVDLSVPRNIDPESARVPGVQLRDIDELLTSQSMTLGGVADASAVVEEELSKLLRWMHDRIAAPRIAALLGRNGSPAARSNAALHREIELIKSEVAA